MTISGAIGNVVDALKGYPLILASLLTNVALLVFIFYSESRSHSQHSEITKETHQILAKCVPSDQFEKLMQTVLTNQQILQQKK